MVGGAWWATVHGIAKSRTRLSNFTSLYWKKRSINAELSKRFKTFEEAEAFLQSCKEATFAIDDVSTKPLDRKSVV